MTRKRAPAAAATEPAPKAAVKPKATPKVVLGNSPAPAPEPEGPTVAETEAAIVAAAATAATDAPDAATTPDAEALAEAQREALVEAQETAALATPPAHITEVRAELPFGKDPNDLAGDDEVDPDLLIAAALAPDTEGVWATYIGQRGDPVAITLIVPDPPKGYTEMVTEGRTYVLALNKPKWVDAEHATWLKNHPAYPIEIREP